MTKRPFFSVIVAIYGTEPYFEQCLRSLLNQQEKDFECIVVNDSSLGVLLSKWPSHDINEHTFKHTVSLDKVEEYKQAEKIFDQVVGGDARFRFVSKPNGGVGSARNIGLDMATGSYLVVIDSDDYAEPDYLFIARRAIESRSENEKGYTIFYGSLQTEMNGVRGKLADIVKFLPSENNLKTMLVFPTLTMTPINYFWSIDLLRKHNVHYSTTHSEDTFFTLDSVLAAQLEHKNIRFQNIPATIVYRQFPGQLTRSNDYEIKLFAFMLSHMTDRFGLLRQAGLEYWILGRLFMVRFWLYRKRLLAKSSLQKSLYGWSARIFTGISLLLSGARNAKE